jgi:hypothetical protein
MDLGATILLVLISITIGYLLNALVASTRKNLDDGDEQVSSPTSISKETVRLWRDPHSQQLRVEIGEDVLKSAAELSAGQRERLAGLDRELGRWLAGPDMPGVASEPPPQERAAHTPIQPQPAHIEQAAVPSNSRSSEPENPGLNPFKIITRAFRAAERPAGETSPDSIVAQIDVLLQTRLEGTHLATRGIRLVETHGQGMAVQVGLESYPAIEVVPDPEVRAAIRQAVADWEARLGK